MPIRPLSGPSPNMRPHPTNQYAATLAAKTTKFFERMLTAFFARHMPVSTHAKPRFMKNTSMPVMRVQIVFILTSGVASASLIFCA